MKSKTLHIISPIFDIKFLFPNSVFLKNINQNLSGNEYHISLGDITAEELLVISSNFDVINFIPNEFDTESSVYKETVVLLSYLSHRHNITNFSQEPTKTFLDQDVQSRTNDATLWVFGCSTSYGVGVETDQRYANILSKNLNMPLNLVAKSGSSTQWSFRHIIHANLQPNDIVVWQLTGPGRFTWANPTPCEIMLSNCKQRDLISSWNDSQMYFYQLSLFHAGINYLRAKSVQCVIISAESKYEHWYKSLHEYAKHPEFLYLPNWYKDKGSDNLHIGPLSHKSVAQALLNRINYNNV